MRTRPSFDSGMASPTASNAASGAPAGLAWSTIDAPIGAPVPSTACPVIVTGSPAATFASEGFRICAVAAIPSRS